METSQVICHFVSVFNVQVIAIYIISINSLFSCSMVLSKISRSFRVSFSYLGGQYQACSRKGLLKFGFTSMDNISRLSDCKFVRRSKSILSLTNIATSPPCMFLSCYGIVKSLRVIFELSVVLSSLVSLIAIVFILFFAAKISVSSSSFTNDGALSEQSNKPFRPVDFPILSTLVSFCLVFRDVQAH